MDISVWNTARGMFHIGDVIRKLREQKGRDFTQTHLGRLAGLNKDTIRRIEQGETMRTDSLEKIATAFGYTLSDLYSFLPLPKGDATLLRSGPYNERLGQAWNALDDADTRAVVVSIVEHLAELARRPPRSRKP